MRSRYAGNPAGGPTRAATLANHCGSAVVTSAKMSGLRVRFPSEAFAG